MLNVADFASVEDAFAAIPPGQAVAVYFPSGTYTINKTIEIALSTVHIKGDGPDATELRFANGVSIGIRINNSGADGNRESVWIGDLSVTTASSAVGTAIEISYEQSFNSRWKSRGLLYNMEIRGTSSDTGWRYGVVYSEGVNLSLSFVSFLGKHNQSDQSASANTMSQAAIVWAGTWTPCELHLSDCLFTAWDVGININQRSEGVYVHQCLFLLCRIGVRWYIDEPEHRWRPLLAASNCHLNVYDSAFYLAFVVTSIIHDNLIYLNDSADDGHAIVLQGCGGVNIHDNIFQTFQSSCNGIILTQGSQYCEISRNLFTGRKQIDEPPVQNWSTGVWLQEGTAWNVVADNNFYEEAIVSEIYDQGLENVVRLIKSSHRVMR